MDAWGLGVATASAGACGVGFGAAGARTTGAVAIRHQRNFIGCELNPAYVSLAEKRIGSVAPMFAEQTA